MNICVHSCTGPRERVLAEHLLLVRYKASAVSLIYYSIPGGPMCGRPTITYSIDYRIAAPSVPTLDCWNPLFRYSKNTTSGVDCFFTDVSKQLWIRLTLYNPSSWSSPSLQLGLFCVFVHWWWGDIHKCYIAILIYRVFQNNCQK